MAKSALRLRARELRRSGASIRDIAGKLSVSKSSASRWCEDIELTPVQIEQLIRNSEAGIRLGQINGGRARRERRAEVIRAHEAKGRERFRRLSDGEFFVAGVALYLAEGAKTMRQFHFVNSDPRLIRFMLDWLHRFFGVRRADTAPSLLIHEIHRPREEEVLAFWGRYLGMPRSQFRKTVFVTTKQRKVYENHQKYYGTLRFTALKSTDLWYNISGLIGGLLQHVPTPV